MQGGRLYDKSQIQNLISLKIFKQVSNNFTPLILYDARFYSFPNAYDLPISKSEDCYVTVLKNVKYVKLVK